MKFDRKFVLLLVSVPVLSFAQTYAPAGYFAQTDSLLKLKWPNNRTVNFVFHGHSVPSGYLATPAVTNTGCYPMLTLKYLDAKWPYAVKNIIKTSLGGETSAGGNQRFASDVLPFKPVLVFIDYALNDRGGGLAAAKTAWQGMITKAKAAGVRIALMTPTPDKGEDILDPNALLAQHARQIRSLAEENSIALVDSYEAFRALVAAGTNLATLMAQSNHINTAGHEVVAKEIMKLFDSLAITPVAVRTDQRPWPGPAEVLANVNCIEGGDLRLFDLAGRVRFRARSFAYPAPLERSLAAGVYVEKACGKDATTTRKIVAE